MAVRVRPAEARDAAFLARVLVIAESWRDQSAPAAGLTPHESVHHYIAGWPRVDDFGVVAEDDGPVGAAWARFFPRHLPGYGFVDEDTPEISIGVEPPYRRQGVGRRLLDALTEQARQRGLAMVSLNVENDNRRAVRLYLAYGFTVVGEVNDSSTMVLPLAGDGGSPASDQGSAASDFGSTAE